MNAPLPKHLRRTGRERVMITPEGLALPITLASRGTRAGALILDLVLMVLVAVGATLALAATAGGVSAIISRLGRQGPAEHALEFLVVLWLAGMFLLRNGWFLFFELGPRGATPGKRLTGIRIAARDGGRLTAEMVIARNLLRDIELFVPAALVAAAAGSGEDVGVAAAAATAWFLIFALMPCFNGDRLRAGDLIAGTWVVEAPRRKLEAALSVRAGAPPAAGEGSGAAQFAPAGHSYRFGEAELAAYGEYELQVLERLLRDGRSEAMHEVAAAICAKIGWNAPGSDEARPFLEAYYTQLRARLETGMRFGQRKPNKFARGGSYHFAPAELAVYGEPQLLILEQLLHEDRSAALAEAAAAICAKIGRPPPGADQLRAFLQAYYTQLHDWLDGGGGRQHH